MRTIQGAVCWVFVFVSFFCFVVGVALLGAPLEAGPPTIDASRGYVGPGLTYLAFSAGAALCARFVRPRAA